MKNIAVLINSLTVEYSLNVLSGIISFFKDKDVRLITGQIAPSRAETGFFEYQCWSNAELLTSESIDAVIIIAGSFSSAAGMPALKPLFSLFAGKPVVSISVPTDLLDSAYTKVDCSLTYNEIVHHLSEIHGCKKIGFFSGNLINTVECKERYEAYKNALHENELQMDEKLILHGDLRSATAEKIILENYSKKSKIPFDALICVNDLTAVGAIKALQKLNVKVPDEVKIIGFDNTTHASSCSPKLSTVNQDIFGQGYAAAEIAYKKLCGKKVDQENLIYPKIIYRQSCGCIPLADYSDACKDEDLVTLHTHDIERNFSEQNRTYPNFLNGIARVYSLFDLVKSGTTLKHFFYTLKYLMETAQIETCAVCFYETPLTIYKDSDFVIPEKMKLEMYADLKTGEELFEPGITFNPIKSILPPGTFKKTKGSYIIQPISAGEINYGYILFTLSSDVLALYSIFLKIISNGIAQAYEYTEAISKNQQLTDENKELQKSNSALSKKSKTDELTKILNRRGFLELGQQTIDIAIEMGRNGLVFFADMDNLKIINDTFGHKVGDRAIRAQATVLTQSLRANDVVGRIGGDEFAIVASGLNITQIEKIRNKVQTLSDKIKQEKGFEFNLSCSLGAIEFTKENHNLEQLLKTADKNMYKEKKIKHNQRNS